MNADILNDLAARVEALGGADREVDVLIALAVDWSPAFAMCSLRHLHDHIGMTIEEIARDAESPQMITSQMPRYTASIDAAMTLVPEGWRGRVFIGNQRMGVADIGGPHSAFFTPADTWKPDQSQSQLCWSPALSVCAAALRAHASMANENKVGV